MSRRSLLLAAAFAAAIAASFTARPALAWNNSGHMIVALLGYEQMTPAARAKAVELLRAHPRFEAHFDPGMTQ